jgi:hypothetical protein
MYYYLMKCSRAASKIHNLCLKITSSVTSTLVSLLLLSLAIAVGMPLIASAASDQAYFAVYCPDGGGLSTSYAADNVLTCHDSGTPPLFEADVGSLTSNPNGTHFVTVVEADCYPDVSQVPQAPSTPTGRISCGGAPDATITVGSTFPASSTASAPVTSSHGLSSISPGNLPQTPANNTAVQTIMGIAFGVIGALALLMITVSGLRYIVSGGDPEKMKRAKEGIIYALVGLTVAISAEAIVAFVAGKL